MSQASSTGPVGVLLGASNLRRGLPVAVVEARRRLGPEASLMLALGHGRSFALTSRFIVRTMPGILQSGLWHWLSSHLEQRRLHVLLTDVGNDLIYGASEDRITSWIEECLDRFPPRADVTLALPPLASLSRLGRRRFVVFANAFFPGRSHDYDDLMARAKRLHVGLSELGEDRQVHIVEPPLDWYGVDPIHIRAGARASAWRELLGSWGEPQEKGAALSTLERGRILMTRPHRAKLLGVEIGRPQPALQLGPTEIGLF